MNNYTKVYDYSDQAINFTWLLFGLFFILVGIRLLNNEYRTIGKIVSYKSIPGYIFIGGATLFVIMVGYVQISEYIHVNNIIKKKTYKVVEGNIQNFNPMPSTGHQLENFTVQGVFFEYSDFVIQQGFNNIKSHDKITWRTNKG